MKWKPMSRTLAALAALMSLATVAPHARAEAKTAPPKVKVTAKQATHTALKKYHGKVEGKVALENEDGKWQYAVNVRTGKTLREVMVDANTGKIASVEVTNAKEEAREKADEAKPKAKDKGEKDDDEKGEAGEKG